MRLRKGSPEARAHMARLRSMVGQKAGSSRTSTNPPRTRAGAERALDKQIEASYYRHAQGVQVSVMDIPKIFRDIKLELAGGVDIDTATRTVVSHYRKGGEPVQSPPSFIVIESNTGSVVYTKKATGMGNEAIAACVAKARQLAARTGNSYIVFLDIRGYKVGHQLHVGMIRTLGITEEIHPTRCNPGVCSNPRHRHGRRNPLTVAESREIAEQATRDAKMGVLAKKPGIRGFHLGRSDGMVDVVRKYGPDFVRPNPLLQTVMLAANPGTSRAARVFMSTKIKKLVGEGYPQKQAVAIAYSMARKRGMKVNPLTRAEAADTLRSARRDLKDMKSEATHHGRSFLAGRAVGKAWAAKIHGPDREEHPGAETVFRRGYRAGLSLKNPPLASVWDRLTHGQRQELLEIAGVVRDSAETLCFYSWNSLRPNVKGLLERGWEDSSRRRTGGTTRIRQVPVVVNVSSTRASRRGLVLANNPPTRIPWRKGQKIPVEQARAWVRSTRNRELIREFEAGLKLQTEANKHPEYVEWMVLPMGSKNRIDSVTSLVQYGTTDETIYKPPRGSKKGDVLYRHKWGEGSGRRRAVPLLATATGRALIMPLGTGQKARDWLRG